MVKLIIKTLVRTLNKAYYIHSDFFNFYSYCQKQNNKISINQACIKMLNEIKEISDNKIIVPTFNYDFSQNKTYNYQKNPSQVGFFSEYFRKMNLNNRTLVPMFSDCSNFKIKKYLDNNYLIFGKKSLYSDLADNNCKIVFFGSNFAPSYIMYLENFLHGCPIYRYPKKFSGKIYYGKKKIKINIIYNCRPLKIPIVYDLKKIEKDILEKKILKNKKSKIGYNYKVMDVKKFKDFCINKIKKDEYYFLKNSSKLKIQKFLKKNNDCRNII